jgi:hypothetical protein
MTVSDRGGMFWLLVAVGVVALIYGGKKVYDATRGLRNNNPGNIRLTPGTTWLGQVPPSQQTDPDFVQTSAPEYGVRMIARLLVNYGSKNGTPGYGGSGIDTVYEIISRWAPPGENDTASYIAAVSDALGVEPNTVIDIAASLPALVPAIIQHENGIQPYDDSTIARGIAMAA